MRKNLFLTGIAALALFTACSKDYDGPDMEGVKLTVTGTVDEITTRVTDNAWEANDAIGITGGDYTNLEYKYTSDGAFDGKTAIVANADTEFTAYHPFTGTEGTAPGEIDIALIQTICLLKVTVQPQALIFNSLV